MSEHRQSVCASDETAVISSLEISRVSRRTLQASCTCTGVDASLKFFFVPSLQLVNIKCAHREKDAQLFVEMLVRMLPPTCETSERALCG